MNDGFINVLKPPGMTSHDIVSFIRKVYSIKKVGHAGTLDPGAAGVLPVALGKATRFIEYLSDVDKAYRAELTFGFSTDSGDDTGKVLQQQDFIMPSAVAIKKVMVGLTGIITQIPPVYSAIKINGQRACDLARKNIKVEIPKRQVCIHSLTMLTQRSTSLILHAECSKGTYIRTLCMDLGKALQIPATMTFLVRTRVGSFSLENAFTLEEIKQLPLAAIHRPDEVLSHLPVYKLPSDRITAFINGLGTDVHSWEEPDKRIRIYGNDRFIGIGRYDKDSHNIIPEKIFMK